MSFYEGKKVLVTGGCGFIGSHLAESLVKLGAEVTVADNFERGNLENVYDFRNKITITTADLRSSSKCDSVIRGHELVFHLAFKVGGIPYTGSPSFFGEIWRDGTRMNINVIESCRKFKVAKLLFTSSACVYPSTLQTKQDIPLEEEAAFPAMPDDAYGWSKLLGELQCKWYYNNYGLDSVIIRPFNVYGEREFLDREFGHALPVLCRKAIEYPEFPFTVHGDGNHSRSFIYVADLVEVMLKAMELAGKAIPINAGTAESTTVKALVDKIIALSDKDIIPQYQPSFPITGVKHRCPNLSRAKELLNWTPKTSLDEGLAKTYSWIKDYLQR